MKVCGAVGCWRSEATNNSGMLIYETRDFLLCKFSVMFLALFLYLPVFFSVAVVVFVELSIVSFSMGRVEPCS